MLYKIIFWLDGGRLLRLMCMRNLPSKGQNVMKTNLRSLGPAEARVVLSFREQGRDVAEAGDQNSATGPVLQGGVQSAPLTESCPYGKGRASCCLKSWFAVVRHSAGRKTMSELALMYQIL